MKFLSMFEPIQIGNVTVPNRFVVPPMGNNFANTDGSLSERSLRYYEARAKGGFGLITIESTVVCAQAKGGPRKPCLFSDTTVGSFRRVIEACHQYGAKVSVQLQHAGPEGNPAVSGYPLKAASPISAGAGRGIPEAMSREEIYRLIEDYGNAAARAQRAGSDMVEVHCAHGYLLSTFLSERTNCRTDEFGGCFENRLRIVRLILERIREKTEGQMAVLCRINASDEVEGGQSVQDAAAVAAYLAEECGVDGLHVTRSVHLRDEFMWAPGCIHGGFNGELVTEIKRAVDVPVIAVGRFTEPQYAELLLRQGRADLIAFGRQSIADPELPNKAMEGRLEELMPCIGCLLGCVPNMFAGHPITCAVNPLVGREGEIKPATGKKKVTVVGGGPGGLMAAWSCALRGHQVVLLEQELEPGGSFRLAAYPPGKGQITAAVRAMAVRCRRAGVKLCFGVTATPEVIRDSGPDAVVVATGSLPLRPPIPGLEESGCVTAQIVLAGESAPGPKVLVVGGGMVGCETAAFLAERGHQVTVVEMREKLASDMAGESRLYLFRSFRRNGVELRPGLRVTRFYPDGVDYTCGEGKTGSLRGYDTVVLAMGVKRRDLLSQELANFVPQVVVIGDAVCSPGNVVTATATALDAALAIG